jgi:phosphate transport system protein
MTHLHEQLKELRENLLEMAELVRSQFKKSLMSLFEEDDDLANEVVHNERRVNAMELKIDRDCEHIFTLLTPVAQDMRFVFGTLKINADLERIADYAEGISNLILLGEKQFDKALVETIELKRMFEVAYEMLKDVEDAYSNDDTRLARSVFARDKQLNKINEKVTSIVEDYIKLNLDQIKQALLLISIIRKLERVGDHITNIAEEIIFYKEAKVLKHGNKGGIEDELDL